MPSRDLVDADLAPFLELIPTFALSAETLDAARQQPLPLPEGPSVPVTLTELAVRGPAGAPDVSIRIYRPQAVQGPLPTILHLHGGGFVLGSAAAFEGAHRSLVDTLQCGLVAVDYRLAPETRFPGAVEDAYAALAWLRKNGAEHDIDGERIGVMGESAGGGLAASLALLARDRGEHLLRFQHLIYPMLDDRTCVSATPHPFAGEFVWNRASNEFGWASLLGEAPGAPDVSPYAAAARASDLTDLPPTFISTGALDLFVDEDIDYARRLGRAGVPVELHVYPGAFHGFDLVPGARVAATARRDSLDALRRALS